MMDTYKQRHHESTEHNEQAGFIIWFRNRYPHVLIFAIPNGGYRDKATAAKLQVEGVVPGIPDLCVPEWRLWIEMKRKGGNISNQQRLIINQLLEIGHTVIVGYGAEDASRQVLDFLKQKGS